MAVVWATVKDHDGYIEITSSEGEGTRFSLYFPATREAFRDAEDDTIDAYLGKGETVLVVDDVATQRKLALKILTKLGYEVTAASSGEEAIEMLGKAPRALLVLDMIMTPGMDGLDTYRAVLERFPGQRAIIASGYSESERVREAQRLGAGEYVRKPYTLMSLARAVRSALDGKQVL
jgi:two-component system cell cycle sensor histidine kinase/response regulator CckA